MVLKDPSIQQKTLSIKWNPKFSTEEKLNFLKIYFGVSLEKISFWKLYRTIKRLNS